MELAIVMLVLTAVAAGGLFAWFNSKDRRARKRMRAVPLVAIEEVEDRTEVRVAGRVVCDAPIEAPLTGRSCVYWRVIVRQKRGSGQGSSRELIIDQHDGVDFEIHDGTGKAVVHARQLIHPLLVQDGRLRSGFLQSASERVEAFLKAHGESSKGWVFNRATEYFEGVVEPGERVAAFGTGRWEIDPDQEARPGGGYRDIEQPKRLVLEEPAEGPLILSDEPPLTRRAAPRR